LRARSRCLVAALGVLVFVAGCAGNETVTRSGPVTLVFLDSDLFDKRLSAAMSSGSYSVLVEMAARPSLNDIPERLDRWVYRIADRHGGKVEVVADPLLPKAKSAEAASMALALAIKAYDYTKESMLYAPCKDYDATLFVDPSAGQITRVLFRRRHETSS